jgi:hypothetical protein
MRVPNDPDAQALSAKEQRVRRYGDGSSGGWNLEMHEGVGSRHQSTG